MSLTSSFACRVFVLLPLALGLGCSRDDGLCAVQGQVFHEGKEAAGVMVTFHPKGADPVKAVRPTGMTKADGTFTLTTGDKPGAPAGDYIVTFIYPKEVPAKKAKKAITLDMSKDTPDFFKGAYADVNKSAFKVEVKSDGTKLEPFRLE